MDPITLKAVKIIEGKSIPIFPTNYLTTSAEYNGHSIYSSGDIRKTISYNGKIPNRELTFIDPQFILERNGKKLHQEFISKYGSIKKVMDSLSNEINLLGGKNENVNSMDPVKWQMIKDIESKQRTFRSEMDQFNRELENIERGSFGNNKIMLTDSCSFLVVHRKSTNKNALMVISNISFPSKGKPAEIWQTTLPNIFYNPSDASESSELKRVFSKGNPDFSFKYFKLTNDKLLIIYMLHAICLDIKTGKILWKFKI